MKQANKVGEERLPDAKFKFVQKINNKHARGIEIGAELLNKCILLYEVGVGFLHYGN